MKVLGRIKYGEPETIDDRIIHVTVDDRFVWVTNQENGATVSFPRGIAKEVGRTIVKGQNP